MVCCSMFNVVIVAWLLFNLYPFHMDTLTWVEPGLMCEHTPRKVDSTLLASSIEPPDTKVQKWVQMATRRQIWTDSKIAALLAK